MQGSLLDPRYSLFVTGYWVFVISLVFNVYIVVVVGTGDMWISMQIYQMEQDVEGENIIVGRIFPEEQSTPWVGTICA